MEAPQQYEQLACWARSQGQHMQRGARSSDCCQRWSVVLRRDCCCDQRHPRQASCPPCHNRSPVHHLTYYKRVNNKEVRWPLLCSLEASVEAGKTFVGAFVWMSHIDHTCWGVCKVRCWTGLRLKSWCWACSLDYWGSRLSPYWQCSDMPHNLHYPYTCVRRATKLNNTQTF